MNDTVQYEVGPHRVTGVSIFYRAIAGAVGGSTGTLVLFLFILLSGQILGGNTDLSALSPILLFVSITMLFLGSLVSNALGNFLISFTDQEKYLYVGKGILQVLLMNIVIFIFILPVYILIKSTDFMVYLAALQFLFSAMASSLVFNAISVDRTQSLLSIYSVVLGIFIAILILSLVLSRDVTVAFFMLPTIVWFSIGFFGGAIEYYYYQLYKRSGIDVLQTERGYIDAEDALQNLDTMINTAENTTEQESERDPT